MGRLLSACLTVLALGAGAPAVGSAQARPLTRDDLEIWLDGLLPYALEQADVAGAVIAVVKDGQVLLQKGYGFADRARKIPMDPERTVVRGGSVAKVFTWTAVMQLVEQGKLDLDRDLNQYLDFTIPPAFGKPITMRQLMTHTAGFEERQKQYGAVGVHPLPLGKHLETIPMPERIYPPGTVQAYSNYGNDLGAYVVERVSGEPFVEYVERHILKTLGMERSAFRLPLPESLRADMAQAYPTASEEPFGPDVEEPTGDLATTVADMARFMTAHLEQGSYQGVQLLAPETVRLMHAPAFRPMPEAHATALGFFLPDYNGHRVVQHYGDLAGFHTDLELLPDDRVGLFLNLNSDGTGGTLGAAYRIRLALFHHFMDRYFPGPPDPEEPTTATAVEHARLAAGEYEMSRRPNGDFLRALYLGFRVRITALPDGTIETPALLDFESGRLQRWREVGPFTWREVNGRAYLDTKVEQGKVVGVLPRSLDTFILQPVSWPWSAAVNLPLLKGAAAVLLLSTVLWPVGALLRRRYRRPLELGPREARARRFLHWAALIGAVYLLGWMLLLAAIGSDLLSMDPGLDPWVRLVQLVGLVCVAGTAPAAWGAWATCRSAQSWWPKLHGVVVTLALVDLVWFSFAFSLISSGLNY